MGILVSRAVKPFKDWNILNRAIRQTEKDKIHPRSATRLDPRVEAKPDYPYHNKIEELESKIKVFDITSVDVVEVEQPKIKSNRPLPQKYAEFHVNLNEEMSYEPVVIPEGKLTVSILIDMLKKFRGKITIEELADEYKLPPEKINPFPQ